jgi:hypothetical protein
MRAFTLSTLFLFPAVLAAQAPADISQQLKTEQPAIEKLLKELRTKDALAKGEALIATPKPVYNNENLNTVAQSQNTTRDMVSAHILAARTIIAAGDWEKANAILEKGLALAKENKTSFLSGAQPTVDTWAKAEANAKAFQAAKPARIQELKDGIAKVQAELANPEAIKKMNKAERNALEERRKKAVADAEELKQLEADKAVHDQNMQQAAKVHAFVDGLSKDCDDVIKIVATSLEKNQGRTKIQKDEIAAFNAKLLASKKKVQIKGNSNWVDAVLNEKDNITRLPGAETQVSFLNRLLVLDPGNAKAQKVLGNILAGKAPFEAEKPAPKGKSKKSR